MSKRRLSLGSRIGPRGQVVIPQSLRDALNTSPNLQLFFSLDGNRIIIEKRDPEQILEEVLAAVTDGKGVPRSMDWDREYYEQSV